MVKKISKIFIYVAIAIVLTVLIVFGLTQTSLFRNSLRSTLYTVLEKNLNASMYLGEIHGNLFSGFTLDTVALYVDNARFVEAGNIKVKYDPLSLWRKHINVISLSIDQPSVQLIRYKSGEWNIDRLSKSTTPPDSLPTPWTLAVKNLKITNANFRLIDSTQTKDARPDSIQALSVDYSNLDVQHLSIELAGALSSREQTISIANISFDLPREKFSLKKLSAELFHSSISTEIRNLQLATPLSHIECNARLQDVDVFTISSLIRRGELKQLQNAPVDLEVTSTTIASKDLITFLPSLYFLRGSVFCEATVNGTLGNLAIEHLDASFNHSTLHLSGNVTRLHTPHELTLDVRSEKSIIQPMDVVALLPYFSIPKYKDLGETEWNFHYVGKPLDFQATAEVQTQYGILSVDGGLDLTGDVMKYKGTVSGSRLNLEPIFLSHAWHSRINFVSTIEGEGVSVNELQSHCTVRVDSSEMFGVPISQCTAQFNAGQKKISATIVLTSPKGSIESNAALDFTLGNEPSYAIEGKVRTLDLSAVMKNNYYSSDCSFDFSLSADRFSVLGANADASLQFRMSRFGAYLFDGDTATLHVRQTGNGQETIVLQSPIADITLNGKFTIRRGEQTLQAHANTIQRLYEEQYKMFDTSAPKAHQPLANYVLKDTLARRNTAALSENNFSISYKANLKNLKPVSIFLQTSLFDAQGTIEGTMEAHAGALSLEGTSALSSASYALPAQKIAAKDFSLAYNITNLQLDSLARQSNPLRVALNVQAENIRIGETVFQSPHITVSDTGRRSTFFASTKIDTMMSASVAGAVEFTPTQHNITLTALRAQYLGYELINKNPIAASVSSKGFAIDTALFVHNDEEVLVHGTIGFDNSVSATLAAENFSFADIHYFITSPDFRQSTLQLGGTLNAEVILSGTLSEPVFQNTIVGNDLAFRESKFGYCTGSIRYAEKRAEVEFQLVHSIQQDSIKNIVLKGIVPIDLSLTSVENRTAIEGMDVALQTANLQFGIFDPFIPEIDRITGMLQAKIHCTGSLQHPQFHGDTHLSGGKFVFSMNGMTYNAEGSLLFDGTRISFPAFSIHNQNQDYGNGLVRVGGSISMLGFVPHEYHLSANGELMVLQEKIRNSNQLFYGDLVAATGTDGLHFDGTSERSRVSGLILVKQASLTFPPVQQASSASLTRIGNIIVVDDTTKKNIDVASNSAAIPQSTNTIQPLSSPTFLDGLSYEMTMQTQGIVRVQMVFNTTAGAYEELYAELDGKLTMASEGKNTRLIGTIKVSDQSSYTFYKKFNASGSLTFTGRPDNPELNIIAKYEGTHADTTSSNKVDTKVIVSLNITGTRITPDPIKIGLTVFDVNGKEVPRTTGDIQNDAIAFLLTSSAGTPGKFLSELESTDRTNIASNIGESILFSSVSGLLSGVANDFVQKNKIPFVKKTEIRSLGADPDVRISGEILDAYFSVGGRVLSGFGNFSVQLPLGDKRQRNFMFEVERKVENLEYGNISRSPLLGARVYYRFTF